MSLVQIASLMMLASGALHAVVNAILKAGHDKMSSRALIDGFSAILILPAVFFVALPHGAWGWLAASWLMHLVYLICLIRAFEAADMSVAYPILRGVAPALAAAAAVLVFAEPISLPVALGVGLVSVGVLAVALGRHVTRASLGWALATGACIAVYTVIDAQGVRAAPSAFSYIVWVFVTLGGGIAALFAIWRGPRFIAAARTEWRPGLIAGALSILTYGLALSAFRMADVPRMAALRETSILFATAIAVIFLKEKLTRGRFLGIAGIAAGAAVLIASG